MANERHLEILRQGAEAWNAWRRDNAGTRPDLCGADLRKVNLSRADLSQVNLIGAVLRDVDLREGQLSRADLRGAVLRGADLNAADLSGANLGGAHVNRANLGAANLNGTDLTRAVYSMGTIFPQAFDPSAHGMKLWL